jgi:anoctamin-8
LKGAAELQLERPVKTEYGGGYKIFLFDELELYDGNLSDSIVSSTPFRYTGVQNKETFFTSQERQSIVKYLLDSIRMTQKQEINGIKFKTDQPFSEFKHRDEHCERSIASD